MAILTAKRVAQVIFLAAACLSAACASERVEPLQVLILNSLGRENSPYEVFASAFRAELAQRVKTPVAYFETSMDGARFDPARDSEAFEQYLKRRYGDRPIDLVVPIGPPAARFYGERRERLFPGVPMLVAVGERRVLQSIALKPGDGAVTQSVDIPRLIENILQVRPATSRIAFVIGNSPIEQFWIKVARAELAPFAGRVSIEYLNTLSLEQVEQQVASLPPDAAILFTQMYVDGAGVSREHDHTLARIHAAADAPIFGVYESQLGKGIVGGPLMSERELAIRSAELANLMLGGAQLAQPVSQVLGMSEPAYDARELERWHIFEGRLPQPSTVVFRPPTLWQQHKLQVIAAVAVGVLQSILLGALWLQRVRRRQAEHEARSLSGRILTAHEDERRRLARELHDDVTPRLARLAIEARRNESQPECAVPASGGLSMHDELVRLSDDVHAFSYRLHPTVLDDLGLADALQSECDRIAEGQALRVAFDAGNLPDRLPTGVAVCLFRIAQEALRNVTRHALARRVEVTLARHKGGLRLAVLDDGQGFDTTAARTRPGLGLASMRERVRQFGGDLDIDSTPGEGTTITAWVPLTSEPS